MKRNWSWNTDDDGLVRIYGDLETSCVVVEIWIVLGISRIYVLVVIAFWVVIDVLEVNDVLVETFADLLYRPSLFWVVIQRVYFAIDRLHGVHLHQIRLDHGVDYFS